MAAGDIALAAGMDVVNGAITDASDIDDEINLTRDYIAQRSEFWAPRVFLYAHNAAAVTGGVNISFNTIEVDTASGWDSGDDDFTVPVAGDYQVTVGIQADAAGFLSAGGLRIRKNDVSVRSTGNAVALAGFIGLEVTHTVPCVAGDRLAVLTTMSFNPQNNSPGPSNSLQIRRLN